MLFRKEGGFSIPNTLYLGKLVAKIHNYALLRYFYALFCSTARMPLISRISPGFH